MLLHHGTISDCVTAEGGWLVLFSACQSLKDIAYQHGDVLVFGSESSGLPQSIKKKHAEQLLTIPSRPRYVAFLSNTAAIVAYEAIRQWGGIPG